MKTPDSKGYYSVFEVEPPKDTDLIFVVDVNGAVVRFEIGSHSGDHNYFMSDWERSPIVNPTHWKYPETPDDYL